MLMRICCARSIDIFARGVHHTAIEVMHQARPGATALWGGHTGFDEARCVRRGDYFLGQGMRTAAPDG
jgi:hypothetical protein